MIFIYEMVSFEPLEIISICIVIAAIIIVSPQWLILLEKHKKEKRIRESPLCNPARIPDIVPPPPSTLETPFASVAPSGCITPNLNGGNRY